MTRREPQAPCPPEVRLLIRGHQAAALQHPCPHCEAPEGRPCQGARGHRLRHPHASRFEAAGLPTELEPEEQP